MAMPYVVRLRRQRMKARFFKDSYGSLASIRQHADSFRLIVSCGGRRYYIRNYSTYRGARIALGKLGDCWKEVV